MMRSLPAGVQLALGALALSLAGMVAIAGYGLCARPGTADVAIVFGNTVERNGAPSRRLAARLEAALRVYRDGQVRALYVSGGIGREGFDESLVMRDWLLARGVPGSVVARDSLGSNSARTAAHARAWMTAHAARRADIVTQYFHVARATLACRAAGIEIAGAAAPAFFEWRDLYSLARELVAIPAYALRSRPAPAR